MKAPLNRSGRWFVAVTAALIVAGCGAPQNSLASPGSGVTNMSRHAGPLADPSTEVDIQNSWTASIAGSGHADCWTISPSLPIVGAGDITGPITLTYHVSTSCGVPSGLGITYGPAVVAGNTCTFTTVYDVNFTFSVTQGDNTKCSIEYPPEGVSAIFTYNQKTPGSGSSMRLPRLR